MSYEDEEIRRFSGTTADQRIPHPEITYTDELSDAGQIAINGLRTLIEEDAKEAVSIFQNLSTTRPKDTHDLTTAIARSLTADGSKYRDKLLTQYLNVVRGEFDFGIDFDSASEMVMKRGLDRRLPALNRLNRFRVYAARIALFQLQNPQTPENGTAA